MRIFSHRLGGWVDVVRDGVLGLRYRFARRREKAGRKTERWTVGRVFVCAVEGSEDAFGWDTVWRERDLCGNFWEVGF